MADLTGSGVDELIRALEDAGLYSDEMKRDMLLSGAEIMEKTAKKRMTDAGFIDTGATVRAIGYRQSVKADKAGRPYVDVSVYGRDARGERLAVKAFVLNYGRAAEYGWLRTSLFWTNARRAAEKAVLALWQRMVSEKIERI